MPELPDILVYVEALERLLANQTMGKVIVKSPFVVRTFEPDISEVNQQKLQSFSRSGKRIIWHFENSMCLVIHLMIAGRFHWKSKPMLPKGKNDLAAFQFEHGTMMLTEASKKKRASIHVVQQSQLEQFDRGGLDVLNCSLEQFSDVLQRENRTLKRALTSPDKFDGIGNAYSDEILLQAGLSPLKRTQQLKDEEIERLFENSKSQLTFWTELLRNQTGNKFPERVTSISQRNGGSRKIQTTLSQLRDANSAHRVCGKRMQLLSKVPNRRKNTCRSITFATPQRRMAKNHRRVGDVTRAQKRFAFRKMIR